jgi:hypothetical protein
MTSTDYDPIAELHRLRTILVDDHDVPVEHDGQLKGWRREKPLLTQLRAAAGSNIGATQGGGSAANTKVPVNVGAMDLHDRIRYEAGDMHAELAGVEVGSLLPDRHLSQWLLLFTGRWRQQIASEGEARAAVAKVRGWTSAINDLLDPPYRYPITRPCPNCQAVRHAESDGATGYALNVIERPNPNDWVIRCRACESEWTGENAARELSMAIDLAEKASA